MARHDSTAARREAAASALEQTRRRHRTAVAETAATLKARARAARLAGLDAVTIHLPVGDTALIATALTEWATRGHRDETRAAIDDRKGPTR